MGLHLIFLGVKLFSIAIALVIHGSTGYDVSTSPSTFSRLSPMKAPPDHANRSNAPNPASQPDGHTIVPSLQPSVPQPKEPKNTNPVCVPVTSATSPPTKLLPPTLHTIMPGSMLPSSREAPDSKAPVSMPIVPEPGASPVLTPWPSIKWKGTGIPTAAPPNQTLNQFSSANPPLQKVSHSPVSLPPTSQYNDQHVMNNSASPAPLSVLLPPHASSQQGPSISPAPLNRLKPHRKSRQWYQAPLPMNPDSPLPSPGSHISPSPVPSPTSPSGQTIPFLSPKIPPSGSSPRNPKMALSPPVRALPPPPPNEDCLSIACTDPQTNTPPGSPCSCVLPMQVGLRLSVALYTFFPLVSELAGEIAVGVFVKQSQVRIMGANAASQDPEKTIVLIDLVPLEEKFDDTTAYLIFQRFWLKQVAISTSLFGKSELIYVRYPGLPPSPPASISMINGAPDSGHGNNGRSIQPLGVDVGRRKHENGLSGSVVAIIVLSVSVTVILCCAVAWVLLLKHRDCQQDLTSQATLPSLSKPSGVTASVFRSGPSSASLSFASSFATYTGSAKTFSSSDVEKATNNFNASKILGEGGFGRVYSGVLEDGTPVAVKVLKRDDQQSGREFLAEVEMLSRLHHRNLVKLVGICIEEPRRCLVYELIPNGSVESHLHGVDRLTVPLDWSSRMKIALGTARGLAYLHEDSSPRVIHRDFKSSNILLEHDFTPKVSDFGLARTALDEENRHISTRVMGTFGYVAPEYAMTGHLLVKSDVYSYGVVLLELLTGRKPVDMSQPPGQEHLVTWARPLLVSKETLESIIDPSLGSDFPSDDIAKVAAIASMCVQREVSHRPFMGEVVQALKLVCNESDDAKELGSRSCSQEDLSVDMDARISANSGQLTYTLQNHSPVSNYDSQFDVERRIPMPDLFGSSKMLLRQESGSFRRHSSSGPLRSGKQRGLWQKMRGLSGGTVSEHGVIFKLWSGSH